jgi:hypothetical protein
MSVKTTRMPMQEANSDQVAPIIAWLHQQGLRGRDGGAGLDGVCQKLLDVGLEIERAVVAYRW